MTFPIELSRVDILEIQDALEKHLDDARYDEKMALKRGGFISADYAQRVEHLVQLRERMRTARSEARSAKAVAK